MFLLIGKTSALTMNIAGVIKDWALIFFSYYVFGAPVTPLNLLGYVFCCSGVRCKTPSFSWFSFRAGYLLLGLWEEGFEGFQFLAKPPARFPPQDPPHPLPICT